MKYNFDEVIDRRNTNSLKWDVKENELPMWVADMDFRTAPEISLEMAKIAENGIYGYSVVPDMWYDAIIDWWKKRYSFKIEKQWLGFCIGVVASIASAIRCFTEKGDNVLVQSPVYHCFFHAIENNGRNALENKLIYNGEEFEIDFEDLENKLALPETKLMILCNPHNPGGRIWTVSELKRIGELCKKNSVIVISDEIHCDITRPGVEYTPFAWVSGDCRDNSITCISPSKTFNIPGLMTAAVIVPDKTLREKLFKSLEADVITEPNILSIEGAVAAYTKGGEWVDEMREYVFENRGLTEKFLEEKLPSVKAVKSDATYLVWLDCRKITDNVSGMCRYIRKKTGLYLSEGNMFRGDGAGFIRMNIACPKDILFEGLERLKKGVDEYIKKI